MIKENILTVQERLKKGEIAKWEENLSCFIFQRLFKDS